jgi:flagellar basal-body rod protein FlgG
MMRSLWTAASGMNAQQQNIDTISNNLANVNTVGHKKERLEFKSLMYQTMERAVLDEANNSNRPVNLQVGHGVKASSSTRIFTQGSLNRTEFPLDFAITGNGFFVIDTGNDTTAYTRDGSFKVSAGADGNSLVTSDGFFVLGTNGERITFPAETLVDSVVVERDGIVTSLGPDGEIIELGQIDIVQFPNPQGLEATGGNRFVQTSASGDPMQESAGEVNVTSSVIQGALEMSNVSVADEMINLIVAQRGYELNSRVITTSDEMLQLANNLKR